MYRVFILLLLSTACVEQFDFNRKNSDPQLVIEAYVSDLSYNESLDGPSDGRFFIVKLRSSTPVSKVVKDRIVPFAEVKIIDDLDNEWPYYEYTGREWGTYVLPDKDFKACSDRMYKLQITTHDELVSGGELVYESSWEAMPATITIPVQDISFGEDEVLTYHYPAGEEKITTKKVIDVFTSSPTIESGNTRYYKWEFSPMWVYVAPKPNGPFNDDNTPEHPIHTKCWITSSLYLNDYTLLEDGIGGFKQKLFSMDAIQNDRIYRNFSVLVSQQSISKDYFFFSNSMQEQLEPNGLFDTPPANLPTNFTCLTDPSKNPIGYFAVVNESTKRWYFDKSELSYNVIDDVQIRCERKFNRPQDPADYAPECTSCLKYTKGDATNIEPEWWKEN